MRLEPKEKAIEADYDHDVVASNAAMLDAPIPMHAAATRFACASEVPHARASVQRRASDYRGLGRGLRVSGQKETLDEFTPARLLLRRASAQWLRPTLFVQSDDPRLVEKAKVIVGDEADSFKAATKLSEWVYENVQSIHDGPAFECHRGARASAG